MCPCALFPHRDPRVVERVACVWLLQEGMRGFYKGWAANTMKVVPQNAIRFVAYEFLKGALGVQKAKTDT